MPGSGALERRRSEVPKALGVAASGAFACCKRHPRGARRHWLGLTLRAKPRLNLWPSETPIPANPNVGEATGPSSLRNPRRLYAQTLCHLLGRQQTLILVRQVMPPVDPRKPRCAQSRALRG